MNAEQLFSFYRPPSSAAPIKKRSNNPAFKRFNGSTFQRSNVPTFKRLHLPTFNLQPMAIDPRKGNSKKRSRNKC
jgi:hypothetical protein